jgi:hypothetical protein
VVYIISKTGKPFYMTLVNNGLMPKELVDENNK